MFRRSSKKKSTIKETPRSKLTPPAAPASTPPLITPPPPPPPHSPANHTTGPGALALCTMLARTLWLFPTTSPLHSSHLLLTHLAYGTDVVPRLWSLIETGCGTNDQHLLETFVKRETKESLLQNHGEGMAGAIALFCMTFNHLLIVLDDSEIYVDQTPLPRASIVRLIHALKILTFRLHWEFDQGDESTTRSTTSAGASAAGETKSNSRTRQQQQQQQQATTTTTTTTAASSSPFFLLLRDTMTMLLRNLYDRSSRRPIAFAHDLQGHASMWLVDELRSELGSGQRLVGLLLRGAESVSPGRTTGQPEMDQLKYLDRLRKTKATRAHQILRRMPWSVPFEDRLLLFQHIVKEERNVCQDGGDVNSAIRVRVRRSKIFQDAYDKLNKPGMLKKRIYVIFVNPMTGEGKRFVFLLVFESLPPSKYIYFTSLCFIFTLKSHSQILHIKW